MRPGSRLRSRRSGVGRDSARHRCCWPTDHSTQDPQRPGLLCPPPPAVAEAEHLPPEPPTSPYLSPSGPALGLPPLHMAAASASPADLGRSPTVLTSKSPNVAHGCRQHSHLGCRERAGSWALRLTDPTQLQATGAGTRSVPQVPCHPQAGTLKQFPSRPVQECCIPGRLARLCHPQHTTSSLCPRGLFMKWAWPSLVRLTLPSPGQCHP